jgi:LPS export ABC transporter protein LptC/lipopolysaccharide transport protein LptA
MPENKIKKNEIKKLERRARLPQVFRFSAIFALGLAIIGVGIAFYLNYGKEEFRMKGLKELKLSDKAVAEVQNYERRETEGYQLKYLIKADKAITFEDNHQELENVLLQVFDQSGEKFDKITANKAIYIPDEKKPKIFTTFFAGDVNIETRDNLNVKTEQLTYKKETEIADAEEFVEFSRENISGNSYGAIVNIQEKTLEMLKEVEINSNSKNSTPENQITRAKIKAGHGYFDQPAGKIEFSENVSINITPDTTSDDLSQPTDIKSNRATAYFIDKEINKIDLDGKVEIYQKPTDRVSKWTKTKANRAVAAIDKEVKRFELFENVDIETSSNDSKPTKIKSNYALYEKDADRFELKKGVEIITVENNQPTNIRSNEAIYEQLNGKIHLFGNAEITQGNNNLKGDKIIAQLDSEKNLKNVLTAGNSYLKQTTTDRTTEITANELNAIFGSDKNLEIANSKGSSRVILIPVKADEYSKITLFTPKEINLKFQTGLLKEMQTSGRTTISLHAPNNKPDAANKTLTADKVKTFLDKNGKDLTKAEAIGDAELIIQPLQVSPKNYLTTIKAPRFDCDFYPGNNAKLCTATGNTNAIRVPTSEGKNRGKQNLTANRLEARFNQQTNDVEQYDAIGDAKFSELDRKGIADKITLTQSDEFVRLRGGEPTVWDSKARAKAGEIDWDTANEKSYLRGKVSTTYYSQSKTDGATPFGDQKSPVFITSNEANFDHPAQTGVYIGNARAWQENNYVRADKLILQEKEGKLYGEGSVQSLLYDAKRKENGRETSVPVYASSDKILYIDEKKYLRYENNVDIRQGSDRILAGVANVYLDKNNALKQTIAENNVVITQPTRKATGEYANYNALDETVILRGNPAKVEDRENGSTQGAQMTVLLREDRVINESKTAENNTGRIRTVYKVKEQP